MQGRMQTRAMKLVDISRLQELTGITEDPHSHEIVLGAALTFNRITEHRAARTLSATGSGLSHRRLTSDS